MLCGGMGNEVKRAAENIPKALAPIGGMPILVHVMNYTHSGFTHFIICLGYKGNSTKQYIMNYELTSRDFKATLGREEALRMRFLRQRATRFFSWMSIFRRIFANVCELVGKIYDGYDFAVGSTAIPGARVDRRSIRDVVSKTYNWFVRRLFGFKASKRSMLLPLLEEVGARH